MHNPRLIFPFLVSLLAAALCACSLMPDYMRPDLPAAPGWKNAEAAARPLPPLDWWKSFGNSELDGLMTRALAENTDLRAGLARIEQARANVAIQRSVLLPGVSAGLNASRTGNANGLRNDTTYRALVSVGYEVDLFGRNRAAVAGARAQLEATRFDQRTLQLLISTDTAQGYINLVGLRERTAIAEKNLAASRDLLELVENRFAAGAVSALEVAQQRSATANTEAQLETLRQQANTQENALAVLLGVSPVALAAPGAAIAAFQLPEQMPPLPAQLLETRPDILAAEAQLVAADADIGIARANFFPSLDLSGDVSALFDSGGLTTNLAASLLGPIFQGGALTGALDLTEARKRELVENYRKTVLVAFREVEDALAGLRAASARERQLRVAAAEAGNAYRLSRQRFDAGAADFLTLLDSQRAQFSADDGYIQARVDRLTAGVQLAKALGTGAEEPATDPAPDAAEGARPPATPDPATVP